MCNGLLNSLKNGLPCGRCGLAKSMNFTEFLASELHRIDFAALASYITRHLPNEKPARSRTRKSSLILSQLLQGY